MRPINEEYERNKFTLEGGGYSETTLTERLKKQPKTTQSYS